MTGTIHLLIEKYGLFAVFFGCVAEGESAAILAGFFAHQQVFNPLSAYLAVFLGAFTGDALFFAAGRRFSKTGFVSRLRATTGFEHAFRLVQEHPATFVVLNRYAYGFRLVGGVAAGLSGIPFPTFLVLNALSAAIWAALFCGIGYVFGLGAEQVLGAALHKHGRLLVALALGIVALAAFGTLAHVKSRHAPQRKDRT